MIPKENPSYIPLEVSDPKTLEEIFKLREEVWRGETALVDSSHLSNKSSILKDDHEGHAWHWALRSQGKVVAAARLCIHDNLSDLPDSGCVLHLKPTLRFPIASLNRLVIHKSVRGQGLAVLFDKIRIEKAWQQGAGCVVGEAAPGRVKPLRALGFHEIGITKKEEWEIADFTFMALDL